MRTPKKREGGREGREGGREGGGREGAGLEIEVAMVANSTSILMW